MVSPPKHTLSPHPIAIPRPSPGLLCWTLTAPLLPPLPAPRSPPSSQRAPCKSEPVLPPLTPSQSFRIPRNQSQGPLTAHKALPNRTAPPSSSPRPLGSGHSGFPALPPHLRVSAPAVPPARFFPRKAPSYQSGLNFFSSRELPLPHSIHPVALCHAHCFLASWHFGIILFFC